MSPLAGNSVIMSAHTAEVGKASPLLVSFCNPKDVATSGLAIFAPGEVMLRDLRHPILPTGTGITGLAGDDDYIYAATQRVKAAGNKGHHLLTFSRKDFSFVSGYRFKKAGDVHSMCFFNGRLLVISTATDQLIELNLNRGAVTSESVYWCFKPHLKRGDNNHLNGLCNSAGGLIVCGFGKKSGDSWMYANEGFLYDFDRKEIIISHLQHPHSVTCYESSVIYCESRRKAVCIRSPHLKWTQEQFLPGYTRGVATDGKLLFAATSVGRTQAEENRSLLEDPSNGNSSPTECTISILDADSLSILQTARFKNAGQEIYDLLPAGDISGWEPYL